MDNDEYGNAYQTYFVSNREVNLGTCWPENEDFEESKEYKQVFAAAESYLKKSSSSSLHGDKNRFPVSRDFNAFIQQNRREGLTNTWGSLSSVFLLLTWYSLRILHSPWRKSYFKIKAFNGHFQHLVYGNFTPSVVEKLMAKLGYIYHKPQQTFLFHQQTWSTTSWRHTLTQVGMDFFLIHVRCSIGSTQTGSQMLVSDLTSVSVFGEKSVRSDLIEKDEEEMVVDPGVSRGTPRRRYLERNFDRVEAFPNKYVSRDVMLRHHKVPGSEPGGVPWQHRFQSVKLSDATASLTDDAMDLYQGQDENSLGEATIRYPPDDLGFKFFPRDKQVAPRKTASTLPKTMENYVTALPMTSHNVSGRGVPRNNRVESGYYKDWVNVLPLDKRSDSATRKGAGEYVDPFPLKRPPGDGEPNSSLPPYHEIVRTPGSPDPHASGSRLGGVS